VIPNDVIEIYKTKVGELRPDVKSKLLEEDMDKEIEETEKEVSLTKHTMDLDFFERDNFYFNKDQQS
jgi:hypothetical protein